jgi:tetratricopeptide (TPR) repeat protein
VCAAAVLATGAAPAHADDEPRGDDARDEAADRAEALADAAYRRFEQGGYAEAIELYRRAYEADPSARILFDIATVYDQRLHEPGPAQQYYRRYTSEPDAEPELTAIARARLEALAAPPTPSAPTPAAPSVAPSSPPADRPEPPARPLRPWGWVSIGLGAASLVAGGVLGIVAISKNSQASSSCTGDACTDPRALTLTQDALDAAHGADVAFAAGALLTAAGVVLVLWPGGPAPAPAPVHLTASVGGFAVSGSWR